LKFLGQAKKFFNALATEPEPMAQYFNVRCVSGHRVRGERTEGYQALRCPACGEGVFVLPRSPLPAPPAPQRQSAAKSMRASEPMVEEGPVELTDPARVSIDLGGDERALADADIVWDDALPEPPPKAAPKPVDPLSESVDLGIAGPPKAAAKHLAAAKEAADRVTAPERRHRDSKPRRRSQAAPDDRMQGAAEGLDRRSRGPKGAIAVTGNADGEARAAQVFEIKPARPMRAINRLLLVVVPCLVIATVAWRYRQQVRQGYPAIVEKGRTEGIKALDEGDFDKAFQLLAAAKSAVDGLSGAVEGADEVRQAADESAIFVNLITRELGELLDEAGRTDPITWDSKFDSLYKGRSIVVDSIITAVPDGAKSTKYELLFRALPPGEATNRDGRPERAGELDLTNFQLLQMAGRPIGDRVIFGATLASFKRDSESGAWLVRLEPKSGVFITHTKALDSFGRREEPTPTNEAAEDQP
jgi:DNA-directed RNA polymerase subunit RPC12/RpoP